MSDPHSRFPRDERGMALVIALLVLLVISLLATVLMVSVNVESKLTSHGLRQTNALNVAEAGIGEAQARIASGDIVLGGDPHAVAQIFNVAAGNVPVLGADTTALATAQPGGSWLPYSTASRGPDVLTVEYKTDGSRSAVYRYDVSRNPAVQTVSGMPIYVITSTGTVGGDVRRVRAEVYATPVTAYTRGAVVADVGVSLKGNIDICGLNHSSSMPTGATDHDSYETHSGDLPGVWSTSTVTQQGSPTCDGYPDPTAENQVGFYSGPWDALGMTQSAFFSWIGTPMMTAPQPPVGLVYVAGNAAYHGGDGTGLLYVTGDLTLNGNFTYRGLIYVEGDLQINGQAWILGGIIVKGTTTIKLANGNADVFYSSEMISEAISQAGGDFTRLSWRELY